MMDANILFHSECDFTLSKQDARSRWIINSIINEGKRVGGLSFVFCTDEYLLEKNIQFLDHDTYTDIITFDYCEGDIISGDIFVSVERVIENSNAFGVDFEDELDRVLIHGVLHLAGYQDKSKEEVNTMREKEDFYLSLRS
ncbi:MAG: rRNA maturation RNase YbeY [Flavobacteriales bacterium]|nr:rRNA maturation RNase YbeY [Flavobacteriales bacterium]